jgi:hypothetical protein
VVVAPVANGVAVKFVQGVEQGRVWSGPALIAGHPGNCARDTDENPKASNSNSELHIDLKAVVVFIVIRVLVQNIDCVFKKGLPKCVSFLYNSKSRLFVFS